MISTQRSKNDHHIYLTNQAQVEGPSSLNEHDEEESSTVQLLPQVLKTMDGVDDMLSSLIEETKSRVLEDEKRSKSQKGKSGKLTGEQLAVAAKQRRERQRQLVRIMDEREKERAAWRIQTVAESWDSIGFDRRREVCPPPSYKSLILCPRV